MLLFSIHIFYLVLFYITPASGSFVFSTEDGCWTSEKCIANLRSFPSIALKTP